MTNYRKIGDFITRISIKNTDDKLDLLLGININKYFMPSVANVVGTDLSRYKVVKQNQFACNRMHVGRDKRLPVAISKVDYDFIVSPAYDVFEIINTDELIPEYLMMWFERKEFDRNCWFHTDTDVRGKLGWDSLCDIELPIPNLQKQQEIVNEYNTIVNRIKLNEQLNQKLEETAQAIYKHWFVDFEFPNKEGEPYKSNGGKMVFNEELEKDVPVGWEVTSLGKLIDYFKGYAFKSDLYINEGIPIIRVSDLTKRSISFKDCFFIDNSLKKQFLKVSINTNDIIITTVGSWAHNPDSVVGKVIRVPYLNREVFLNQNMVCLRSENETYNWILYYALIDENYRYYVVSGAQGSANQASVTLKDLFAYNLLMPNRDALKVMSKSFQQIIEAQNIFNREKGSLAVLKDLLLSKMSKIELEKEIA